MPSRPETAGLLAHPTEPRPTDAVPNASPTEVHDRSPLREPSWTVLVHAGEPLAGGPDEPVAVRRIVLQMVAAALVVLTLVGIVGSVIARRTAERQGVHDAASLTDVLAASVVQPQLTDAMLTDPQAATAVFAPFAKAVVTDPVVRVKLWTQQGQILWSDDTRLVGRTFALDDEARDALTGARVIAAVSDLGRPENVFERSQGRLLEVYRPVWTPNGSPLLLEAYYRYDAVSARSSQLWRGFSGIMLSSMLAVLFLLAPIVWGLVARTRRAQAQREALLLRAADMSLIERRRIAGALHDGLVQELAAATYVVAAQAETAERRGDPQAAGTLRETAATVRGGIGGLRALLVDLYPPNLRAAGLAASFRDVATTAAARGVQPDVAVADDVVVRMSEEQQEAVFRVGQEALRNAARHSHAHTIRLTLAGDAERAVLEVEDDGVGLGPEHERRDDSFGRRLMADQAERVGAELAVRTAPGAGTSIRLTLDLA